MNELDLETRELCPDGACVGVLGADGRCPICGAVGVIAPHEANGVSARLEIGAAAIPELAVAGAAESGDSDHGEGDDDRRLCPDGSCIGLIGTDGRCKVCGATAA